MGWKQGSEQALSLTAEAIKGVLRQGNPAPSHHKRWVDTINHIVNPPRTPDTDKDAGRLVWSFQKSSTPDAGRGPTAGQILGRDGCERARGERGAADSGRPMTTGVCAGWCHAREGGKVHGGRAGAELVVAMISGRAVRGRAAGEEEAYKTHDGRRQGRVPAAQQERRRSAHKML